MATKTYDYSYDATWKDKLLSITSNKDTENEEVSTIATDAIGNPLDYNGWAFTWEHGRQLAGMTGNGKTITYKYNDSGIRTQKTVNGVTTTYHLLGDKVTYEENGVDKIYYTYDSSDNLISMNLSTKNPDGTWTAGVEYYYIRNAQGDIIGLYDGNGTQMASYSYDSWGKLISIKDGSDNDITNDTTHVGVKNPYRYRGYRYDSETQLYYLNSRYYNPEWCRFINMDALGGDVGKILSHNAFAYCTNNPVNMDDPSGYLPRWAKVAIGVGVIAGLGILTIATAGTGTALACVAAGALKGATIGAIGGALSGAVIGGAIGYATKGISGVKKGALDGAADGFMSGAITGAIGGGITSKACFVAGTQISTSDGNKPIEEIKEGDLVYAYNEETGEVGLKPVVQTFVRESSELIHVKVDGKIIDTTPEHPFYVPQKGWKPAGQLRAGDKLLLRSGKIVIVEIVQHEMLENPITVYNFEVEDWHTYYVSNSSLLVHNTCNLPKNISPKGVGRKGAFNAAKKELGIPKSQQPLKVLENVNRQGKVVPGKVYDFGNGKLIRDDVLGHVFSDGVNLGPHFNVGKLHFFY